jgi:hypothetical protein
MTEGDLDLLLLHAARFKCESVREPLTVEPDEPDAHDAVHKYITVLMDKIIAAKWFLKDLEAVALEWLAMQFKGRAADHWVRIVAAARVTTHGCRGQGYCHYLGHWAQQRALPLSP